MSSFFKLNLADILKGCVVAILAAVLQAVIPILNNGGFPDWPTMQGILYSSVAAGLAYLLKNWFSNSDGKMFSKEA
jgi:hypothetical protein